MRTVTKPGSAAPTAGMPPIGVPISLPRPRAPAIPEEESARSGAVPLEQRAAEEFVCAQCRHAKFDRMRSLCLCLSRSSEFARREVFSGQLACGWFEKRGRRAPNWGLVSARKL
jgi:hypothetical protein